MATFVDGYGNKQQGYPKVNLDQVVRLRPSTDSHGGLTYDCIDSRGNNVATVAPYVIDDHPSGVVPEMNGTILIAIWDESTERYPILAWSIRELSAMPVICESLPDDYCLELQNPKRWIFPEDCCFDDIAAALTYGHEARRQRIQRQAELRQKRVISGARQTKP